MKENNNMRRKESRRTPTLRNLKAQIKEHKKTFTLYVLLRVLVLATLVLQLLNGNYENVFLCCLTLFLFLLPSFVEVNFHIALPDTLEIIVLLFIFSAEILGEINSFYTLIPHWDTVLHTINGFLCAAIGFSMVDILNRNEKFAFSLSPAYLALVSFCFSMTIGVLWEFFECGMDLFFGTDMQKDYIITRINSVTLHPDGLNKVISIPINSLVVNGEDWIAKYGGYLDIGLLDTMKDLFVNFIGAVVFSGIGYFYVKSRGKGKFVKEFILTVDSKDENKNALPESPDASDPAGLTVPEEQPSPSNTAKQDASPAKEKRRRKKEPSQPEKHRAEKNKI